ncbi:hypothetical protein STHERM_c13160 [Spirochaeta thermophila DSM 6192]|uniref:DUF2232 domain-containing protein n=2 Tax=Winmispira thermophila TaxID=154 RepID=E0RTM6_WINT6|nr:hypothetical protein STHERM_c13160 [Spirochaeta thermophila DSM 6192]
MESLENRSRLWLMGVGGGVLAMVSYLSGLLLPFFLVPFVYLFYRERRVSWYAALGTAGGGLLALHLLLWGLEGWDPAWGVLVGMNLLLLFLWMGGLVFLVEDVLPFPRFTRLIVITVAAAVVTGLVVAVGLAWGNLAELAYAMWDRVLALLGGDVFVEDLSSKERMETFSFLVQALGSSLVVWYMVILAGNWYFGWLLSHPGRSLLAGFRAPAWFLWWFLLSFAGFLLERFVDLPLGLAFAVRNAFAMGLVIYGVQGVGVLSFHLRRLFPRGGSVALIGLCVVSLLIPGMNLLVGVLLPGLGIAEYWLVLRPRKES